MASNSECKAESCRDLASRALELSENVMVRVASLLGNDCVEEKCSEVTGKIPVLEQTLNRIIDSVASTQNYITKVEDRL